MNNNFKIFLGGIALFISLFSVNVFSQEVTLEAQVKMIEIQDRVDSMTEDELNEKKDQLLIDVYMINNVNTISLI